VSISLRDPSVNALIAEHGGSRAIAQSFAWYQTAKSVAGSLSKAAAGVLISVTGGSFSLVFLIAFALSLAPLAVVRRWVPEIERPAPPVREAAAQVPERRSGVLPYASAGLLISASGHMLSTLFPLLAVEYAGLTAAQTGVIYVFAAAAAMSGPAFGWLSDNVSRRLVLQVRGVANVLSSAIYLVAPGFAGFAAGRVVDDMGKAAFRPAWGALMTHVSAQDRRRRAQTMGYMSAGEDAGEMLGPLGAGLLWSAGGVGLLLGARIGLALVAEVYTAKVAARLPTPPRLGSRRKATEPRAPEGRPATRGEAARVAPWNAIVDINAASVDELTLLPVVGRRAAKRIVDYRDHRGPFSRIEDLTRVEGFTSSRVARLAERARL
jgi:competence ComEA-like helix-hairpin-helix protein